MFIAVVYLVVKYAAYAGWCFVGLQLLRRENDDSEPGAWRLGLYRLLLGFAFGIVIYIALSVFTQVFGNSVGGDVFTYIFSYLPVRWVEWTIMSVLVVPGAHSFATLLVGLNWNDRVWRVGGIGISFLADVPILLSIGGFPIGRFLC